MVVPIVIALRYGTMGLTMTHFLVKRYGWPKRKSLLTSNRSDNLYLNGFNRQLPNEPNFLRWHDYVAASIN